MEQDIGFEPMTFSLATKHSTTELILHNMVAGVCQPKESQPSQFYETATCHPVVTILKYT
jgi:hypothetical protein